MNSLNSRGKQDGILRKNMLYYMQDLLSDVVVFLDHSQRRDQRILTRVQAEELRRFEELHQ